MSNALSLFDLADCMDACANTLNDYIMKHYTTLDPNERFDLQITEGRLRAASSRARAKAVQVVLTDLADPGNELKKFTGDINAKIASISGLNNALNMIAKLLKVAGEVLNVATSLSTAPAAIAGLVP